MSRLCERLPRCIMYRHRRNIAIAAAAARKANEDLRRARLHLEQSLSDLPAAREEDERLRELNESNGYGVWLISYIRGGT